MSTFEKFSKTTINEDKEPIQHWALRKLQNEANRMIRLKSIEQLPNYLHQI